MNVRKIKKDKALCASCHYTVGTKKGKAKIIDEFLISNNVAV